MKKRIIIMILSAGIAGWLGLKSDLLAPIVEAAYCAIAKDEC